MYSTSLKQVPKDNLIIKSHPNTHQYHVLYYSAGGYCVLFYKFSQVVEASS